ncbi:MAG TPA: DNA polymerase III subunit delta [Pseudomonadota bacterium]|nr:DNA polymerase III subunit delta [Pseudomonadota bacterium]
MASTSASSFSQDPLGPLLSALSPSAPPLIFLTGKERFLIDRAVEAIKAAVLDPATRDFNYDTFFAKEAGAAKILACAKTLPMMAKRRLVLVRDGDAFSADELLTFAKFVEGPAQETCLVFVAEKVDMRLRFFTLWKKHGLLLKLDPLSEKQLPGFVEAEARRLEVQLKPGVAVRLIEEVGTDLAQLADALERLCCYVPVGQPIRPKDVEDVVVATRQHSVFELVDAIGANDRAKALTLLSGVLSQREPALKLLALLSRHVVKLWQTADLLSQGRPSVNDLAKTLNVLPFVAMKLIDQTKKLKLSRVQVLHEAIFQTDRTLKQTKLDDERVMEQLVLKLCTA